MEYMNSIENVFKDRFPRVLVTGGAGFIGSCLIRNLLKITNSKIFNLDKLSYSSDLTSIDSTIQKYQIDQKRYEDSTNLENVDDLNKVIKSQILLNFSFSR